MGILATRDSRRKVKRGKASLGAPLPHAEAVRVGPRLGWVRIGAMNRRIQAPGGLSTNPFVQALSFLLLGLALIGAVLMGAIVIAFLIGLFAILGVVVWIRLWWLRRRMHKARGGPYAREADGSHASGRIIDVEYEVVDRRSDDERRD